MKLTVGASPTDTFRILLMDLVETTHWGQSTRLRFRNKDFPYKEVKVDYPVAGAVLPGEGPFDIFIRPSDVGDHVSD